MLNKCQHTPPWPSSQRAGGHPISPRLAGVQHPSLDRWLLERHHRPMAHHHPELHKQPLPWPVVPRAGQEVTWPKVMALIGGWAKTGAPLLALRGCVTSWPKVGSADQQRPRSGVPATQNCRPHLGLDYKALRPPVKSQKYKSDLDSKLFQKSERCGMSLRQLPSPWPPWPRCSPSLVFPNPHPAWEPSSLPRPSPGGSLTCCCQQSE